MRSITLETGLRITLVAGSITEQPDVDCIVNAANAQLRGGAGVCGAIYNAAGRFDLDREVQALYPPRGPEGVRCPTGQAVVTGAYRLPNTIKGIVHAVGPIYDEYEPEEAKRLLRASYFSSLEQADLKRWKSIAFPAISCGVYGYPWEEAAHEGVFSVLDYLRSRSGSTHLKEVRFVIFEPALLDVFEEVFDQVGSLVAGK